MDVRGGRDLRGRGLISLRMLRLVGGWPSVTLLRIGLWRIRLIILPSMRFLIILCMLRDILRLVMPRIPSPSQRTDPPNSSTSSSRETKPHGSTTPPNVRDDSSAWPTKTDPPRLNAVSTLPVPNKPLIVICGKRVPFRTLHPLMRLRKSLAVERRRLLPCTHHGANSAREWKRNLPSMLRVPVFPFTSSVEMRSVTLSRLT
mmetsp:Transcript_18010/g.25531  ORF Transcript_18010/g.25531 Transcript_18010/m.25531 type:complete len:202 (-) Transcript_18010:280-885(-)